MLFSSIWTLFFRNNFINSGLIPNSVKQVKLKSESVCLNISKRNKNFTSHVALDLNEFVQLRNFKWPGLFFYLLKYLTSVREMWSL